MVKDPYPEIFEGILRMENSTMYPELKAKFDNDRRIQEYQKAKEMLLTELEQNGSCSDPAVLCVINDAWGY